MSFTSLFFYPSFIILLILLVITQNAEKKNPDLSNKLSKVYLLIFSFFIIASYDWRFCLCIATVIAVTYYSALRISAAQTPQSKQIWTYLAVIFNIVFLCIFKYLNFFLSSLYSITGHEYNTLNIILPVGISFYIFSAISYILDVSWGKMEADKSVLNVALFLAFFPKMLCGPIARGHSFLPQLNEPRPVTWANFKYGIQVFVFGLFKKIVLSDNIAVFVNQAYDTPLVFDTFTIWWAVLGYFLQLYFDFSGYSDMAIGISRILGYDLEKNFNLPFSSRNISDFWQRWHMSLTSWLNDYLFNPCAMKLTRKMKKLPKDIRRKYKLLPSYTSTLITFFICGMWHGAGMTFIIYGLINGVISVLHEFFAQHSQKRNVSRRHFPQIFGFISILLNYICMNLIQVFFRAASVSDALQIYSLLFSHHPGVFFPQVYVLVGYIFLISATAFAYIRKKKDGLPSIEGFYPTVNLSTIPGMTIFFSACMLTFLFAYFGESFFIYGNF